MAVSLVALGTGIGITRRSFRLRNFFCVAALSVDWRKV